MDMDNVETQPLVVLPGSSTMVPTQPEPTHTVPTPWVAGPLVGSSDATMESPPAPIDAGHPKPPQKVIPPVPVMPAEKPKPDVPERVPVPKMQYVPAIMIHLRFVSRTR